MKSPDHNTPEAWERQLDRQLKALPARRAPASLLPRVLAAVEARARVPWYQRTWVTWPRLAQVASLLVVSFLLGVLTYATLHFPELGADDSLSLQLSAWLAPLRAVWDAGLTVVTRVAALLPAIATWMWVAAAVACAGLYLFCIGLGTVIYRMATNK